MAQQFYQPRRSRRSDDPYDDGFDPFGAQKSTSGSSSVSDDAQHTVDNVDQVLAENGQAPHSNQAESPQNLKNQEEASGNSANINNDPHSDPDLAGVAGLAAAEAGMGLDQLGNGFNPSDSGKNTIKQLIKSRAGRRGAIVGGTGAGIVGLLIAAFFALLPLKIEHIVTNLQDHFAATSEDALGKEAESLLSGYIRSSILPSVKAGKCHSTVSPNCVVVAKGTGPIGALYSAWSKGKLEQKLATKYGIIIGKTGDNKFFMNINGANVGNDEQIRKLMDPKSGMTIFDLGGTNEVSRTEIRQAVSRALKDATLWDRTYFRLKVGKMLEEQFGIKRCIIACNTRDKFSDTVANKKLAAKALIVDRVIAPLNESYGLIIQCIFAGESCNVSKLDKADENTTVRQTEFQKKLQGKLDAYAARYGTEALADLADKAKAISDKGFSKYFARELSKKIAGIFGKEISGEATEKAVPVVGWVLLIAQLLDVGHNIGPMIRYMSYAANAAAAVQLYEAYSTLASEAHSGHMDATELGSFTDALSTNLSGSPNNQSDATQTPLYGYLMGSDTSSGTVALGNALFPTAYAASNNTGYTCDDGNPVPAGKLVCTEEKIDRGNGVATDISNFLNNTVYKIPGMSIVISMINKVGNLVGSAFGTVFTDTCNTVGWVLGCPPIVNKLSDYASQFMNFIVHKMVASPFGDDMSGGRTFDMMAAGADISGNMGCQVELGCAKASDQLVASIQNRQKAEEQREFNAQPLFARIFSTSNPYSLVSRMALSLPNSNLLVAVRDSAASLLSNPLHTIGAIFSSVFSPIRAFAAATPQPDPFGVIQYAYSDDQIPSDPQAFWDKNCVNGPLAKYNDTTKKLDISNWLNQETLDPNTGQAVANTPNACLLIQSSVTSAGALYGVDQ